MAQKREDTRQSTHILVMGIVNATPDSFYDGGRFLEHEAAIAQGLSMVADGADILDVGGESSRPGSQQVSSQQEMDRILPVIEGLRSHTSHPISVDTTKSSVARAALDAGADIINDISALRFDPAMAEVVAASNAQVILMHMQGTPLIMQQDPMYDDVVEDVRAFLIKQAEFAKSVGISPGRIILDPGIGFGKQLRHNISLLQQLPKLASCGYPVLVGLSRKSFLGEILDLPTTERLEGTIVANTLAILGGASIIRVHDVKEGRRTADVAVRLRT